MGEHCAQVGSREDSFGTCCIVVHDTLTEECWVEDKRGRKGTHSESTNDAEGDASVLLLYCFEAAPKGQEVP